MTLHEELKSLLKKDERFVSEDKLLKNKIVELSLKLDKELIKLLLGSKKIKEHFFEEVEKTLIFDKEKFMKFVDNKEFLPDSYTSFKNKIGLTSDRKYLAKNKEVVLSWPFKDCILEGGQEKEDEKRKEIFHNEILAPDEIDRLLEPKVFTNFKKFDVKGENKVTEIKSDDNLIIKGNNLLVLHSLQKRYSGRVKLIYIDPPYNTGSDSFGYNDNFNHSTWLTFMKNRLEVAKKLLGDDGAIFIQIDHHELAYVSLLLDEIFGIDNKVQIISVKVASPSGFKAVNPGPIDVTEYILFYTKNKSKFNFKRNYVPAKYHSNYNLFIENKNEDPKKWNFISLKNKVLEINGFKSINDAKKKFGETYNAVIDNMIAEFAFNHAEEVVSIRDLHKPTDRVKKLQKESKENGGTIKIYEKVDGTNMYLYKGGALAFYSSKIKEIDGKPEVIELLSDFWDHISWAGIAREGDVQLKNGKKPEKLIKQIMEIATSEGDIVLDYHLGSGTTCAAAHKFKRQYIGIEQLDYGENDSVQRLKNVIGKENSKGKLSATIEDYDTSGISKAVNWKGGGSFVYCELKQLNEEFVQKIKKAKDSKELLKIWEEMKNHAFLSYRVDEKLFDENIDEFKQLSTYEQKKLLVKCLDANNLYVNFSEMEDSQYKISKEDKDINKKLYGGL
jgi:adenine-specific DNA-methyltransferase